MPELFIIAEAATVVAAGIRAVQLSRKVPVSRVLPSV